MADFGFQAEPTPATTPEGTAQFGFTPEPSAQPASVGFVPEKQPDQDQNKSGWVWSAITTNDELQSIADKHKVPVQDLKDVASYFGATKENETVADLAKQAAGFGGEAGGLGLPQKFYKKLQTPQMERALDDLSELAEQKKSTLRDASEFLGGAGMAGVSSFLGPAALPALGAAAGYAHSRAGDELAPTAIGAVAAPIIGKAVETVAPYIGKAAGALAERLGFRPEAAPEIAGEAAARAGETAGELEPPRSGNVPVPPTEEQPVLRNTSLPKVDLTKSERGVEDIIADKLDGEEGQRIEAEKKALISGDSEDLVRFMGGENRVVRLLDPSSTEYKLIVSDLRDEGMPVNNRAIAEKFADNKLQSIQEDVAKRVGADSWEQAVKEKGGTDFLANKVYDNMAKENLAIQTIKEDNLGKNVRKIGTVEGMLLKLADDKPVMKIIDKRLGGASQFSAEQATDAISEKTAKFSPIVRQGYDRLGQFDAMLKEAGVSREDFNSLYRRGQAPEELKTAWDSMTKDFLDKANANGAGISARENYMRDQLLPPNELSGAVQAQAKALSDRYKMDVGDLTDSQFNSIKNDPQMQQLVKAVDLISGKAPTDSVQFTNGLKDIVEDSTRNSGRLYSNLSAAKEKIGEIPEFIQEKDPVQGMQSWLNSTYKNLATREELDRLRSIANIAEKSGDDWTAKHLRDKIQDILGVRKDTLAGGTKSILNQWSAYWHGKGQDSLAEMPQMFQALVRNQYPNLVGGLNIKLSLQHMATPMLSGIPDIGIADGTRAWWNSLGRISDTLRKEGPSGLRKLLEDKGMLAAHMGREMAELGEKTPSKLNQLSNDALMFTFRMSELIGRGQAYFMGQELGARMGRDPEWASKFIARLNSPSYRKTMMSALQKGDVQTLQDQMSRYINSTHLLNYDRAHQSAFARYAGPVFTAFQKWPSTMYGKVLQEMYDKGIPAGSLEVAKKILAPTVALSIADHYYHPDERMKKITGPSLAGLTGGAELAHFAPTKTPIQTMLGTVGEAITGGHHGKTPMDQSLSDTLKQKEEALRGAANAAAVTFLPYMGWLKMFGEDLPTLIYDRKPQGLPLERRIETIARGGRPAP